MVQTTDTCTSLGSPPPFSSRASADRNLYIEPIITRPSSTTRCARWRTQITRRQVQVTVEPVVHADSPLWRRSLATS